jgi:hypothetical protein
MVFADMRGTEIIRIWDEPYPLIYADGRSEEDWKIRRSINKALEQLDGVNIPHRFSFYQEEEPDGLFFRFNEELSDGKCKLCGKEFDHDGLFCSEICETAYSQHIEERKREIDKHNENIADLEPKKRKKKTNATKWPFGESLSGEKLTKGLGQTTKTFESPSEMFKKRKASRDKVKHPRY